MLDTMVYQEYFDNKEYRFEVYRSHNFYEIQVQHKITDDYMGEDWFDYCNINDYKHCADTIEKAIEIGRESLRCLI